MFVAVFHMHLLSASAFTFTSSAFEFNCRRTALMESQPAVAMRHGHRQMIKYGSTVALVSKDKLAQNSDVDLQR